MTDQPVQPDQSDPVAELAERLIGGMADLAAEFGTFQEESGNVTAQLGRYGRRSRAVIVADLVLTVTLFFASTLFVQSMQHSDAAGRKADKAAAAVVVTHQTAVSQCQTANSSRADLRGLLALAFAGQASGTPAQQKAAADFRDTVNTRFPDRDCSKIP